MYTCAFRRYILKRRNYISSILLFHLLENTYLRGSPHYFSICFIQWRPVAWSGTEEWNPGARMMDGMGSSEECFPIDWATRSCLQCTLWWSQGAAATPPPQP
jgi:hypothetical protein